MKPEHCMHSFEPTLARWVNAIKPARVLEFGPGKSTEIIRKCAPGAYIVSVEDNPTWADRQAARGFADKYIVQQTKKKSLYPAQAFVEAQDGPFDLVFVDGRRRVECVLASLSVLSAFGVVLLHDCYRWQYMATLAPIVRILEEENFTVALRPRDICEWSAGIDTARKAGYGRQ